MYYSNSGNVYYYTSANSLCTFLKVSDFEKVHLFMDFELLVESSHLLFLKVQFKLSVIFKVITVLPSFCTEHYYKNVV